MACLLLIVSRTEPARVTYFKHVFGGETADVITDRRVEERRQRRERVAAERRREDRRRRDITKDLQTKWLGGGVELGKAAFKHAPSSPASCIGAHRRGATNG